MNFVPGQTYTFDYVNHRGELSNRTVSIEALRFTTTDFYTTPQWLIFGYCFHKAAPRAFALRNIDATTLKVQ